MVTVPEASRIIVERSRYLSEALSKDLINLSSLARYIKPELEQMLMKKITNASIIMSLKRIKKDLKPKVPNVKIFKIPPQIHLITNLNLYRLDKGFPNIDLKRSFVSISELETVVLTPEKIKTGNLARADVAAIIISLPVDAQETSGIHYFFLKSLAWEGINILETFSSSREYVLVFDEKNIHAAFRIISSLFSKKQM